MALPHFLALLLKLFLLSARSSTFFDRFIFGLLRSSTIISLIIIRFLQMSI